MDSLVGEIMHVWTGSVTSSSLEYQTLHSGFIREQVPSVYGVDVPRMKIEKDVVVNDKDTKLKLQTSDQLKISFNGRRYNRGKYYNGEKLEDPCKEEVVSLSPIEVRYHPMVIEKMRSVSVEVATDVNGNIKPKETGGYLGGKLIQDQFGRWYTYVTHVEADKKYDAGTAMTFEYTTDMQHEMVGNILELGLYPVGFWHSHPTYQPFQSDSRLNSQYGNDVQSTFNICTHWWEVAAVIDPFESNTNSNEGDVSLGNYKINGVYEDPSTEKNVGWRSISTGIKRIDSWNNLKETDATKKSIHDQVIHDWERSYYFLRAKEIIESDKYSFSSPHSLDEQSETLRSILNPQLHFGATLTSEEAKNIIILFGYEIASDHSKPSWQEDIEWNDMTNSDVNEEE